MALAIDAGLLVLLGWFVILLLILREFRHFATQVAGSNNLDKETYELCQTSVDKALNYTAENSDTLNDLILIQQALEAQVTQIKLAKNELSEQEQASIDELNQKLQQPIWKRLEPGTPLPIGVGRASLDRREEAGTHSDSSGWNPSGS